MIDVSKDEVARDLALDDLTLPIQGSINAYLINTGSKLILIDTGAGVLYGDCCGHLMANLRAAGYQPGQVDEVRKRLKWAVIDFRAGARDDGGSLGSRDGLLYPKGRSGFGEKAHRYAATFHGSNSSMRLIGWSAMQLSTWHR
jgi:hypothetical protein